MTIISTAHPGRRAGEKGRKEGTEMTVPADVPKKEKERFLERVARLRATPEERARILAAGTPFDYDAWLEEAGPAVPEELAEMEELLREREEERRGSLTGEEEAQRPGA
jgi:hypothetical protein